jgi:hypothetical protein
VSNIVNCVSSRIGFCFSLFLRCRWAVAVEARDDTVSGSEAEADESSSSEKSSSSPSRNVLAVSRSSLGWGS